MKTQRMLPALILATLSGMAQADINIGVSVSATGPAASLGIPEKNTFAILPTSIAGEKINYIVLDDGTDPGRVAFPVRGRLGRTGRAARRDGLAEPRSRFP